MAKKAKTYEVEANGRKARVTVPERHEMCAYSGDLKDILRDVLRDNLSPEAVAAIAAQLDARKVKDDQVAREVEWFRRLLVGMVKGTFRQLCDELGIPKRGTQP